MKATETRLLDFLKGPKQFIVPIYQRAYSWKVAQCEQLWRDILRASSDSVAGHFIGSIVYIQKGLYQAAGIPQLLVIDGQQRLTTLTLLLDAYGDALKAAGDATSEITQRKLYNYYLLNPEEEGDLRYKLLLTQTDRTTLIRLLDDHAPTPPVSERIVENHAWFKERMQTVDLRRVYAGIAKLLVIDIALDRAHDSPQLIFESLNSTGMALTQADLVRNFVLMQLDPPEQERLYNAYWRPMEEVFGAESYAERFDGFMRDYLTVATGSIPNVGDVYQEFKEHSHRAAAPGIADQVAEIARYAAHYARIIAPPSDDRQLQDRLSAINTLRVDVSYPFLLEVFEDFKQQKATRAEVLEILKFIESYVFRRSVCGLPTNSLNKTFANLGRELQKGRYLESLMAALLLKDSYKRFPDDDEFGRELVVKDLYNIRARAYWLGRLENHEHKEPINVEEYTVEHVLPQNDDLSMSWRSSLGDGWKEIQARYLHTLGNLTLTGYNSEMSDRSFAEKRDMPKGFVQSHLRLNQDLATLERWTQPEIEARAQRLAALALKVWPYPHLTTEQLERYRAPDDGDTGERTYTIQDHPNLLGPLGPLFAGLRQRILNLDHRIGERYLKFYVAFRITSNFTWIVPQKSRLKVMLSVPAGELFDPKRLCRDMSGPIHTGSRGHAGVELDSLDELDDVMALVRQAFERSLEE
jgi:uncharacterized protein with ParB-like and HNH nuclease domain/predicted transport protein